MKKIFLSLFFLIIPEIFANGTDPDKAQTPVEIRLTLEKAPSRLIIAQNSGGTDHINSLEIDHGLITDDKDSSAYSITPVLKRESNDELLFTGNQNHIEMTFSHGSNHLALQGENSQEIITTLDISHWEYDKNSKEIAFTVISTIPKEQITGKKGHFTGTTTLIITLKEN